ncbi:MAG: DNA-directed RNA polymerase subunit omega [Lentisphaerae bacterium]|nr:DNA-directed RNA polymerase subunit omega [Lentisphaerota bacterium]MBT4820680.1 DNA-directed RNA polymerase subunit omega [Lentisphaerota bacterium]MBT5610624.1 DNA-directed RNA polymerase subunit omega [Lentisphaerota bacterium]MBT7053871.1 DNA-directed RNA polymerase subunit omega [Lentisphaerota bacterium]MBT7847409.1 DNA-directed RNA polymerase subunit omega [Lentisphaerota bacterium]
MNDEYLELAKNKGYDVRALINGASKRAAELAQGGRPLVPVLPQDSRSFLDIALLEVAEGKVVIQTPDYDGY